MIDLHAHLLHTLDDGPKTLEESLNMCRIAYNDGIHTIVATPHTLNGVYETDWPTVLRKVQELNDALSQCGMGNGKCGIQEPGSVIPDSEIRNPKSTLRILPGADVRFSSEIIQLYEKGMAGTLNGNGKFMMIEFPPQEIPTKAEDLFFRLLTKGIIPIITHPERNGEIAQRPERYYHFIRMGCLGQVTGMSLTNGFGSGVRKVAEKLISHRLIHIIASDAHSVQERPPTLSPAVKAAARILGEEEALRMVTEYPQKVLDGKRPKVPDPIPI